MPPVVNTWSKRARTSFTVPTIVSATSGITRTSRSGMPISPSRVARKRMLASWVRPESTSLPITTTQAMGFAGMRADYRKSRSSGTSGRSAGGIL